MGLDDYTTRNIFEAATYKLLLGIMPSRYFDTVDHKGRIIIWFGYNKDQIPHKEFQARVLRVEPRAFFDAYLDFRRIIQEKEQEVKRRKEKDDE